MKNQLIYDKIFTHYVEKMGGCFLVITPDELFTKTFRGCLKKFKLSYEPFHQHKNVVNIFKYCRDLLLSFQHVILIVERFVDGRSSLDDLQFVKETFQSKIKVIVITNEVDNQTASMIYEQGADNVIVKPVSTDAIIQKVASILSPNNAMEKNVERCLGLIEQGALDDASGIVDAILKQKPDSSIGYMLKGDIAFKRQDYQRAQEHYKKAHLCSKLHLEPFKRLVRLYDVTSQTEKKLEYLDKLDRLSPLNQERKIQIGAAYVQLGKEVMAQEYFEKAVDLVKKQADDMLSRAYMEIGRSLMEANPEKCLEYIMKAIDVKGDKLAEEDVWMFNEMGISLRRQGKIEEAIDCYVKALTLAPRDAILLYNLGMAHAEAQNFEQALTLFEKVMENDAQILHTSSTIPFNIGMAYYKAKRFAEADQMFKIAKQLDPDSEKIAEMLGKTAQRTNLPL